MTVEDAIQWMSVLENLRDGTPPKDRVVKQLQEQLMKCPETFVEEYFKLLNQDDPIRRECERMLKSGIVNEGTTFGDLPAIIAVQTMEDDYSKQERDAE